MIYLPLTKVSFTVSDRLEEAVPIKIFGRAILFIKLVEHLFLGHHGLLAVLQLLSLGVPCLRVRQAAELRRVHGTLQLTHMLSANEPSVERVELFLFDRAHRLIVTILHRGRSLSTHFIYK